MDTSKMVRVRGDCVSVEIDGDLYRLDPAVDAIRAELDGDAIRRAIASAIQEHEAAEATPGGCTVTFPFKLRQKMRVKETGQVKTVTRLMVDYVSDDVSSFLIVCEANAVDYAHPPDALEAIPKTALEVLAELKKRIKGQMFVCIHSTFVLDEIAKLETELKETPAPPDGGSERK